jgi:hypothetical protein
MGSSFMCPVSCGQPMGCGDWPEKIGMACILQPLRLHVRHCLVLSRT